MTSLGLTAVGGGGMRTKVVGCFSLSSSFRDERQLRWTWPSRTLLAKKLGRYRSRRLEPQSSLFSSPCPAGPESFEALQNLFCISVGHLPPAREVAEFRPLCIGEVGDRVFHPDRRALLDSSSGQLEQFLLRYAGVPFPDRVHGDLVHSGAHADGKVDLRFRAHVLKTSARRL